MTVLKGKTALVTGGSRGMGAAIAQRLAAEGANVAITYQSSAERAQDVVASLLELGVEALAIQADAAETQDVLAAVEQVAEAFGDIDILVNNAGVFNVKPFREFSLEEYEQTMSVNVRSVFVGTQAVLKHMPSGGRVITVGSNLAEHVPMPGSTLYSASKAALIGFTKALAREVGEREITANIVHPGSTNTEMNPADGPFSDVQRSLMAIPRYAEPEDIANLVAWIASPVSRSVTGTGFTIDNGTNA